MAVAIWETPRYPLHRPLNLGQGRPNPHGGRHRHEAIPRGRRVEMRRNIRAYNTAHNVQKGQHRVKRHPQVKLEFIDYVSLIFGMLSALMAVAAWASDAPWIVNAIFGVLLIGLPALDYTLKRRKFRRTPQGDGGSSNE